MINRYITLPQAEALLRADRMPAFVRALKNSLNVWNTGMGQSQLVLDKSARAIIINQYWYYFTNQQLGATVGIRVEKEQLQRFVVVDDQLIIRFKLLDQDLRSRNYPTERSQDWNEQLPLSGIPPLTRCEFGYRLTLTGTDIADAFLLLPQGDNILWVWQVLGPPISTFGIQLSFPPLGQAPPAVFAYNDYSQV